MRPFSSMENSLAEVSSYDRSVNCRGPLWRNNFTIERGRKGEIKREVKEIPDKTISLSMSIR